MEIFVMSLYLLVSSEVARWGGSMLFRGRKRNKVSRILRKYKMFSVGFRFLEFYIESGKN